MLNFAAYPLNPFADGQVFLTNVFKTDERAFLWFEDKGLTANRSYFSIELDSTRARDLTRFCKEYERLISFSLLRMGFKATVSWKDESGFKYDASSIPDEAWAAAVGVLRPLAFDSVGAGYRFNRVRTILTPNNAPSQWKAWSKVLKKQFRGKFAAVQPVYHLRDKDDGSDADVQSINRPGGIDAEGLLERWLHGFEQHDDLGKQNELEKIFEISSRDQVKGEIYLHLLEKEKAMRFLYLVARRLRSF